jgi:hypothetical protein
MTAVTICASKYTIVVIKFTVTDIAVDQEPFALFFFFNGFSPALWGAVA